MDKEQLKVRIAELNDILVSCNDRLGALNNELRQIEKILLETHGQRQECFHWLKKLEENDGQANTDIHKS